MNIFIFSIVYIIFPFTCMYSWINIWCYFYFIFSLPKTLFLACHFVPSTMQVLPLCQYKIIENVCIFCILDMWVLFLTAIVHIRDCSLRIKSYFHLCLFKPILSATPSFLRYLSKKCISCNKAK